MQTKGLPCITKLYNLFYKNKVKIIPDNIYNLLTPVALSHWIAGDGQVASNGLRLCTESYQTSERLKLMNVLMIKYRINCSLNYLGGKARIYISAKSMNLLYSIVKPYRSKDMLYKLESGTSKNVQIIIKNSVDFNSKFNIKNKKLIVVKRTFSTVRLIKKAGIFRPSRVVVGCDYTMITFKQWLAGYFEASGHIWIQKQKGSKTYNPRFCITFSLKNEALCKKLLDVIGSGFIRYKRKENACVLVVSPVIGLKKIVNLINGELRTPALWCRISDIVGKKLSNSGDFLKLTVLSQMRKYLCGWINYSATVTNREIQETEIGNRGSKSIVCLTLFHSSQWIKHIIVKEQRVYGNCIGFNTFEQRNVSMLRCTLTGFERNYQVRILSNQLNNVRFNSSINKDKTQPNINPWFLTGFADGEACFFLVNIYKSSSHLKGWGARATFQMGLHNKDISVLNDVKDYFGVGSVATKTKGCVFYVQAIKDLDVILNHFDRYPLVTKKYADYLLFKLAINLIKEKAHLNSEGLRKLVAIRASLNWGLSSDLEAAFPGIIPYSRSRSFWYYN